MEKKSYGYIYQKYIVENKTVKEMCQDIGIHRDTFYTWLKKFGIKKNGTTRVLTQADFVRDSEWLRKSFETKTTSQIAQELGITEAKVEYWLKKYGIKQRFKFPIDSTKVSVNNPVFCYWAGLVATDGHLDKVTDRVTVSLKEETEDVLRYIADHFEYKGNIYHHANRFTLCMSSTEMIKELAKLGIDKYSDKTFEVSVPTEFANEDCLRMYIRGCLDGDGSIKKDTGAVRLYCGSDSFVDGLISLIQSIGIDVKKSYHNKKYPGFELRREPSKQLLAWVYKGFNECRLSRKFHTVSGVWGDDIVRTTPMEKV